MTKKELLNSEQWKNAKDDASVLTTIIVVMPDGGERIERIYPVELYYRGVDNRLFLTDNDDCFNPCTFTKNTLVKDYSFRTAPDDAELYMLCGGKMRMIDGIFIFFRDRLGNVYFREDGDKFGFSRTNARFSLILVQNPSMESDEQ